MSGQTVPLPEVVRGALTHCQGCGHETLERILDLGHHPPCDSLLMPAQLDEPEVAYPLRFCRCTSCGLAQIDYAVDPEILFFREYPYRTAMTRLLRDHFGVLTTEARTTWRSTWVRTTAPCYRDSRLTASVSLASSPQGSLTSPSRTACPP